MPKLIETDCGVIGAGLAGCTVALELANAGKKVDLFVKKKLNGDCNSYLIAGGLAAVPLKEGKPVEGDSFKEHINDTLNAGAGLNNKEIVKFCVENFYLDVIEWLRNKGVKFDDDLHSEGGHSTERVFHVKDTTGISIMDNLRELIIKHPNITIHEECIVIDLITKNKVECVQKERDCCNGFYAYDIKKDKVITVSTKGVFVATGGLGKTFMYTSNTDISTADGFAFCYRAGLELANMEFIQFHPTVFFDSNPENEFERRFLLTEALRGSGAILKLNKDDEQDFILKYDKKGSKATRDVVSRAEDNEMRKNGLKHVWLDCTPIGEKAIKEEFSNSYEFCMNKGIDITKEPVPAVYAVHYANGGVVVDKNSESKLKNCYVIGETSYTGLHGATRLASNSGSECVLFGRVATKHFCSIKNGSYPKVPLWNVGKAIKIRDKTTVQYYWETIKRTMNSLCGISRNADRLTTAKQILGSLQDSINAYYWNYTVTKDFLEVRNIADVAEVIVGSALTRNETRACHFRGKYSDSNDNKFLGLTIVKKGEDAFISDWL